MFQHRNAQQRYHQLSGCGLGALDLAINKSTFVVGEAPGYSVSGGAINAPILWSSVRNGLPTGETLTDYGHKTDSMGVWSQAGGNWTAEHVGQWSKSVKVGDEVDSVVFQVLPASGTQTTTTPAPTPTTTPAPPKASGFFDGTIDLFGYELPKAAVYIGGALAAYLLFFKKR